jgi:hypothetical protein
MLMEFEITWIDRSLVICRTSGVASIEGYRAMMQALTSQPQFRPGVDLIVDHTSVDASALTAVEIEQVAGFRVHFTGTTAGRVAGVIGLDSPMRYGLARIFSAYIEAGGGTEIELFETIDEAVAWVREVDIPVPSELPSEDVQAPPQKDR